MWATVLDGQEAHVYQIQLKRQRSFAHVLAKPKSTKISRLSEVVVSGIAEGEDYQILILMVLILITVADCWVSKNLKMGCRP